jgi:hypothetical protein
MCYEILSLLFYLYGLFNHGPCVLYMIHMKFNGWKISILRITTHVSSLLHKTMKYGVIQWYKSSVLLTETIVEKKSHFS